MEQIQNIFAYDCFFTLIRLQFNASSLLEREIDGAVTRITAQFWSEPQIVTEAQHVDIAAMCNDFNMHLEQFNRMGSGFVMVRLTGFRVCVTKYWPLVGSSYIRTPAWLRKKKCILNIQNFTDEFCFQWSILASLFEKKHHPEQVSHYRTHENALNFNGIQFPIKPVDIARFERQNVDISVNVLSCDRENKGFFVVYLSPEVGKPHHVNLLLLKEEGSTKRHYTLIRNIRMTRGRVVA